MRILGYIEHAQIKMTVFEDNNKIIVQCEDGLCQLSYKYRKGDPIEDLDSVKKLISGNFLSQIESQLETMKKDRIAHLIEMDQNQNESFPIII